MIRPRPTPPAPAPIPEPVVDREPAVEQEPSVTTTGWLRRSLNLGKKPAVTTPVNDPAPAMKETQQMSLFDIEQAEGVAQKKTKRPPAGIRFVLNFSDNHSVTVGERPGTIGVKPLVDDDEVFRIYVEDDGDTVAPEHVEFGVEKGVFWVQDVKTVHGTVVEEPGSKPIQCIPYEKYFVVRGSTVRLGSVSFTLN